MYAYNTAQIPVHFPSYLRYWAITYMYSFCQPLNYHMHPARAALPKGRSYSFAKILWSYRSLNICRAALSIGKSYGFTETLWSAFGLFFDQNKILDLDVGKNNFFDFFFKFNVTIFGILVFSSLIGIITNFISNKIESLRSGKTKIEEENHIIFFNFSRRLIPLLSELCSAYIKEKRSFVVVSNEEPLTIIEKINAVIKIPKNITIVARKGFAWHKSLQDRIKINIPGINKQQLDDIIKLIETPGIFEMVSDCTSFWHGILCESEPTLVRFECSSLRRVRTEKQAGQN